MHIGSNITEHSARQSYGKLHELRSNIFREKTILNTYYITRINNINIFYLKMYLYRNKEPQFI